MVRIRDMGEDMKWFKHLSTARMGNSMSELIDEFGLHTAYACYFLMVEYCAEKWDPGSPPIFKINLKQLQNLLGMKSKRVENFIRTTSELNFWSSKREKNVFIIEFPKLLEILDDTTRKLRNDSGVVPEQFRSRGEERRVEESFSENKLSDAQRQELQFNPDFVDFKNALKEEGVYTPKVRRNAESIYNAFGDCKMFLEWYGIFSLSRNYKKIEDESEKKSYLIAALLSEAGVSEGPRWGQYATV